MLGKLRPLVSLGLGGRLGSGRQYLSWISLADEVAAIEFALTHDDVRGPWTCARPKPVTNTAFHVGDGSRAARPTPWIVPGFAVSALVGEFAREAVLTGQRAVPKVLTDAGFDFRHRTIEDALGYAFGQA